MAGKYFRCVAKVDLLGLSLCRHSRIYIAVMDWCIQFELRSVLLGPSSLVGAYSFCLKKCGSEDGSGAHLWRIETMDVMLTFAILIVATAIDGVDDFGVLGTIFVCLEGFLEPWNDQNLKDIPIGQLRMLTVFRGSHTNQRV